jgi:cell division protein ZapA (FtsZ GTPase activity inhibitor)
VVKIRYGIERIPDMMAMVEMGAYQEGLNVDRLVSLAALVAFAKIQESNRGYKKRLETTDKKYLEKSGNLYKLTHSAFRHMGKTTSKINNGPPRSPFKNLR